MSSSGKSPLDRFSAFFSPNKSNKQQPTSSAPPTPTQKNGTSEPTSATPVGSPTSTTTTQSTSSSSSSTPSVGFFSGLKSKALSHLQAHRAESAEKSAFKASGLEKITSRLFVLQSQPDSNKTVFQALNSYLTTYHDGRYLLLDISGVLAAHNCPDEYFRSSRLGLEFGPPGSNTLGPLDHAARISAAARRWWAAEDGGGNENSTHKNIVVLTAEPLTTRHILAACILYEGMAFTDIFQACHQVLLANENRLMASLHLRSLATPYRKFLSDFALVQQYDRDFKCPKVWLHELRIHRVPQFEEEGTRLLLILIANRTQFVYTSQAQGGGHVWIPTTKGDPLTVVVPLAVEFSGECSLKVWHLPEHSTVNNPRQLILETKIHSAVLCLPCWRMPEEGTTVIPPPALPTAVEPVASSSSEPNALPELNPTPLPTVSTYPLHRLFLRQDELELNVWDQTTHDPTVFAPDVVYDKNFRLSLTCTPMEEVHYRNVNQANSNGSSSSSSANTNNVPAPFVADPAALPSDSDVRLKSTSSSPEKEVDLLQLQASWSVGTESNPAAIEPASPTRTTSASSKEITPPRPELATRTPSNSVIDPIGSPVTATPARRKRTDSFTSDSQLPASTFVPPVMTVPPEARSTAGIRFYAEDKNGLERPETQAEYERRQQMAAERAQFDQMYGPGNWQRSNGVLYTLQQQPEVPPQIQQIMAHQQQQHHQHRASHSHRQASPPPALSAEELARHQQIEHEAKEQTEAATANRAAAQLIHDDPNSSAEEKDAALARILAAEFAIEDAAAALQQVQNQVQAHAHALLVHQQLNQPSGGSSSRHRSSRSHRSSSSSSRSHRARSSASSSPASSNAVPSNIISVAADGSIVLTSATSANGASGDANGGAAAAPPTDDELARAMQLAFDQEESARTVASLAAAQRGLDPDAMHYDQRLQLEELMGASRSRAQRVGATEEQIHQLPEFQLEITSKYLEEECQVCMEKFTAGDILRQLQCIHAYHRECVDPWLRTNRTCPICKLPIH